DQGQANAREMDPDLVRPTRLGSDLELCDPVRRIPSNDPPTRDGAASGAAADRHALAILGVPPDRPVDAALARARQPAYEGAVDPLDRVVGELRRESLMSEVGLGGDQYAGGPAVEAVDDSGPQDAADPGELAVAMVQQGVDQGATRVAGSGVDDQA